MKNESLLIMSTKQERLNRMDLLLLLLLADGNKGINEPIEGKTRLQKQLFLSQKKLKDHKIDKPYSFRPYHYGPYCKEIYSDIDLLEKDGVVQEEQKVDNCGGIVRIFSLTPQGITEIQRMLGSAAIRDQYEIIREIKKEFNSMSVVDLVDYTHEAYKDYATKSIV
jgi:uncharacterized protein